MRTEFWKAASINAAEDSSAGSEAFLLARFGVWKVESRSLSSWFSSISSLGLFCEDEDRDNGLGFGLEMSSRKSRSAVLEDDSACWRAAVWNLELVCLSELGMSSRTCREAVVDPHGGGSEGARKESSGDVRDLSRGLLTSRSSMTKMQLHRHRIKVFESTLLTS